MSCAEGLLIADSLMYEYVPCSTYYTRYNLVPGIPYSSRLGLFLVERIIAGF